MMDYGEEFLNIKRKWEQRLDNQELFLIKSVKTQNERLNEFEKTLATKVEARLADKFRKIDDSVLFISNSSKDMNQRMGVLQSLVGKADSKLTQSFCSINDLKIMLNELKTKQVTQLMKISTSLEKRISRVETELKMWKDKAGNWQVGMEDVWDVRVSGMEKGLAKMEESHEKLLRQFEELRKVGELVESEEIQTHFMSIRRAMSRLRRGQALKIDEMDKRLSEIEIKPKLARLRKEQVSKLRGEIAKLRAEDARNMRSLSKKFGRLQEKVLARKLAKIEENLYKRIEEEVSALRRKGKKGLGRRHVRSMLKKAGLRGASVVAKKRPVQKMKRKR